MSADKIVVLLLMAMTAILLVWIELRSRREARMVASPKPLTETAAEEAGGPLKPAFGLSGAVRNQKSEIENQK